VYTDKVNFQTVLHRWSSCSVTLVPHNWTSTANYYKCEWLLCSTPFARSVTVLISVTVKQRCTHVFRIFKDVLQSTLLTYHGPVSPLPFSMFMTCWKASIVCVKNSATQFTTQSLLPNHSRASCLVPWWVCRAGFVAAVRRWDPIYRCCCVSRSEVRTTWLVVPRPRHAVYCWTEGYEPSTQTHYWLHWTISPRLRATTLLSVMIHNKHIS